MSLKSCFEYPFSCGRRLESRREGRWTTFRCLPQHMMSPVHSQNSLFQPPWPDNRLWAILERKSNGKLIQASTRNFLRRRCKRKKKESFHASEMRDRCDVLSQVKPKLNHARSISTERQRFLGNIIDRAKDNIRNAQAQEN